MIICNFDGGCWPNPHGSAGGGVLITTDGEILIEKGFYVGCGKGMSSNVAEYAALILALKHLKKHGMCGEKIVVRGDSTLVINQMKGKWKIKSGLYKEYALLAKSLVKDFSNISFRWIPRDLNTVCDSLAEEALRY